MAGLEDASKSGKPRTVSLDKVKDAAKTVRGRGVILVKKVQDQISNACNVRYSSVHV